MEKLTCKEIQSHCVEMLRYFDAYATSRNITYYLSGGTLLGAVRHQGFIPWDDDVDLMLPRKDYERLIHDFDGGGRYEIISCETNDEYGTPFARIWDKRTALKWTSSREVPIGVFIDLFPIDGFPENEIVSKLYMNYLKLCRTKVNSAIRTTFQKGERFKIIKKGLKYVWRKSANYYARRQNAIVKKYTYENSKYVGVTTTTVHIYRERNLKTDVFSGTLYLPFEQLQLPVPSGYDRYLQHLYGDYMKLPPVDQRWSEHNFVIYKIPEGDTML